MPKVKKPKLRKPSEHIYAFKAKTGILRLLDEANSLLPDDKLTIFCEVRVIANSVNISGQSNGIQFKVPSVPHVRRPGFAFREPEVYRHHVIFWCSLAMFEHEKEEIKCNKVEITDVEHEVLQEMLRFIHTDKAPNLDKMSDDLLAAADKYALERLKEMWEEALSTKMFIESAADIPILADLHSADQLKAQTIDLINTHATDIMQMAGFDSMVQSHTQLIAEASHVLTTQQISPIGP
ncbi:hypothetical protein PR048_000672 [Dryococelus australis]|uniref:BTB domain-containing protein n=1 Tax=Dryococelus australis TaxID=614101 RepID=A0ABQ9IG68_9NEOP|nr:hypothetical protein PR048_000672 [Dryococelus australis]